MSVGRIWEPNPTNAGVAKGTSAVDHATNTILAYVFGKRNAQKIERKNLNLRTWIKRLIRKTIYFSKLEVMHDLVIGLLINKVEFGRNIYS
jgi:IS1 family transposase